MSSNEEKQNHQEEENKMTMTMKGDRIQMSIIKIYIDKDLCIN